MENISNETLATSFIYSAMAFVAPDFGIAAEDVDVYSIDGFIFFNLPHDAIPEDILYSIIYQAKTIYPDSPKKLKHYRGH